MFGDSCFIVGPVASSNVPATRPALGKPTVPYPALPRNRLKIQAPVPLPPQNQGIKSFFILGMQSTVMFLETYKIINLQSLLASPLKFTESAQLYLTWHHP